MTDSYFVPGFGISRGYLQSTIGLYLGPQAIVRPYSFQGRDGFLVTTPAGQRQLTQQQLEDIRAQSQAWEQQASERYAAQSSENAEVFLNQPVQIPQRQSQPQQWSSSSQQRSRDRW